MRVARLWVEGDELAALVHEGALYRVDLLDDVLGSSLPRELWSTAGQFLRRVFSMGLVDLAEHEFELRDGLEADDCTVTCPPARWLPPCGAEPALFELRSGASSPLRLEGRSLLGHEAHAPTPDERDLLVFPCIGLIVSEDLRFASVPEIEAAMPWMSLGLAWTVVPWEARALAEGLGAGGGRVLGTHLGPWLQPVIDGDCSLKMCRARGEELGSVVQVDRARVAGCLQRVARFSGLRAGDVVLLVAPEGLAVGVGEWVDVQNPALGSLRGCVGLSASRASSS